MAVVNIKSTYRAVCVKESHILFQVGSGGGPPNFVDRHLCLGLRLAPYASDKISWLIVDMAEAAGAQGITNYLHCHL